MCVDQGDSFITQILNSPTFPDLRALHDCHGLAPLLEKAGTAKMSSRKKFPAKFSEITQTPAALPELP
jgi:hypothetical protein